MFNHVMVGSNDIERSKQFYDAVLGVLGVAEPLRSEAASGHTRYFYRHDGNIFAITQPIDDQLATGANGGTIGFRCKSAEQVRDFHYAALAHGGSPLEDPPGTRTSEIGPLYIAYVRDPDGNKLCAIFRETS